MKKRRNLAIAGCLVLLISAGSLLLGQRSLRLLPNRASGRLAAEVVEANNEFGFDLLRQLAQDSPDKNVVLSPLSVSMAYSLVYNGARGKTKAEMAQALDLRGLSLNQINETNQAILSAAKSSAKGEEVAFANSVWVQQGLPLQPQFTRCATSCYEAEFASVNFADPSTIATINRWTKGQTRGMIPKVIEQLAPRTALALVNAAYFEGVWAQQFSKASTRPGRFLLDTGDDISVPMMHGRGRYRFLWDEDMRVIRLPYGKGRLSMYVFVPGYGAPVPRLLDKLSPRRLKNYISDLREEEVMISLPRFRADYSCDLIPPLKRLGMRVAFVDDADFGGICPQGPLWISKSTHQAVVDVNERGTKAAAATVIVMSKGGGIFTVDRPFLFIIRDDKTGALLFMGVIVDPR